MKRTPATTAALATLLALSAVQSGCAGSSDDGAADLILTGGTVWMEVPAAAPATAIAVAGGRVLAVGDDATIRALAGEDTQELPLDGATVTPGLVDAWVDIGALGRWSSGLDLRQAATPRELQAMLRGATPDASGWIVGWGWDESRWPTPEPPAADLLADIAAGRPVLLYRHAGRLAWASAAAMAAAGMPGAAAGIVTDPALAAIEAAVPRDADTGRQWLTAGLMQLAAAGVTRAATAPLRAGEWQLLQQLHDDGDLLIRVDARLAPDGEPAAGVAAEGMLRWAGYAVEIDGPLGTALALLSDDGADDSGARQRLESACQAAAHHATTLAVHVHGDLALRLALGCPAIAQGAGLLIGADLLTPEALPPGVRVAVAPGRLAHDLYFLDAVLGSERAARAHRYRDLAAAGQLAGLTSLAPAYPLAPMAALRVMFTRRDLDGYPLDGWHPAQRLAPVDSLAAALRSPIDGAPARLLPGATADLVIWSEDPLGDPALLTRALPLITMVGGRVIYSRPWTEPARPPR